MNNDELKQYYIENSDLDFELKIYNYLKESKFRPTHAGRYVDEFTGKMREYDILATPRSEGIYLEGESNRAAFHKVEMVVECKNIVSDCPIIVGARKLEVGERHTCLNLRRSSAEGAENFLQSVDYHKMASMYNFFGNEFTDLIGVEAVQIARSGNDRALKALDKSGNFYEKWSQVVSHAIYRYKVMAEEVRKGSTSGTITVWCLPVLIVPDNSLFLAIRKQGDDLEVKPTYGVAMKVGHDFDLQGITRERARVSSYFLLTESGFRALMEMFRYQ